MARGPSIRLTKKQVLEALEQTNGVINDAIRLLGIGKTQFYRKYRYDKEIEERLKELHVSGFEEVTDILYKLCLNGDTKAISLYLKYNPEAKKHLWIENQTLTIKEEKPLTPEEKDKLIDELFG